MNSDKCGAFTPTLEHDPQKLDPVLRARQTRKRSRGDHAQTTRHDAETGVELGACRGRNSQAPNRKKAKTW